jgi:hypothetical protein
LNNYIFNNLHYVNSITIHANAPGSDNNPFWGNNNDYTGKNASGTKTLYVPTNATGYDSGKWTQYVITPGICGFTLSKTLND